LNILDDEISSKYTMIVHITFDEILPIWRDHLWPGRVSKIETNSAMKIFSGYDMYNMSTPATFFAFIKDGEIAGVNSGHSCSDNSYRSRGLYVFPKFRKQGIGKALLLATIEQSKLEKAQYVWSYPKQSSWPTYNAVGFSLVSPWEISELDTNAYCTITI
jgi:GNAT superfamily N-acetyltransferase